MKALTICQPYAWLLLLPKTDPRHKPVENRTWYTGYRGPVLIHAGKSRSWLDTYQQIDPHEAAGLVFGAIIGRANLIDCVSIEQLRVEYPELARSGHAVGPYCLVMDDAVAFAKPIPCSGAQMFWEYRGELPEVSQ